MCQNTYLVGLCETIGQLSAWKNYMQEHPPTPQRRDPHGWGSESGHVKGTAHPSPRAGPPCVGAVGREVKPHTWPEPSAGPAGFWLAQSSPQEPSVELSSSRGQQPVHICAYGEAAPALHRKRLTLSPSAWTFPLGQVTVKCSASPSDQPGSPSQSALLAGRPSMAFYFMKV